MSKHTKAARERLERHGDLTILEQTVLDHLREHEAKRAAKRKLLCMVCGDSLREHGTTYGKRQDHLYVAPTEPAWRATVMCAQCCGYHASLECPPRAKAQVESPDDTCGYVYRFGSVCQRTRRWHGPESQHEWQPRVTEPDPTTPCAWEGAPRCELGDHWHVSHAFVEPATSDAGRRV